MLYRGYNASNAGRLEKLIHEKIHHLPLGRRLNRKKGGWKARDENLERKFIVGVTYNMRGYGALTLK